MSTLIQICDNKMFIDAIRLLVIQESKNLSFIDKYFFIRETFIQLGIHRITSYVYIHHQSLGQDCRQIDVELY